MAKLLGSGSTRIQIMVKAEAAGTAHERRHCNSLMLEGISWASRVNMVPGN